MSCTAKFTFIISARMPSRPDGVVGLPPLALALALALAPPAEREAGRGWAFFGGGRLNHEANTPACQAAG